MTKELKVKFVGDTSDLERAFHKAGSAATSFGGAIGGVAKVAGVAAGAAGIGAIGLVLKTGIGEWNQSTKVAAQTGAVIKSTGGAANVTAKQVDSLSQSLLNKTGIDDEAIKSGENMLLTFTNIRNEAGKGNDVFTQTTKTLTDMSVATGQDMTHASVMLGKAINDPIAGIGALSRVGVTFTQGQKDQIKAMVASGNTMGAQKMILHELNKEFGGSAEAAGKTLPGQINILKQSFNNMAGDLVGKLMPSLMGLVAWTTAHMPQIEAVFSTVFAGIGWAMTNVVIPAIKVLIDIGTQAVAWFKTNWPQIRDIVLAVMTPIVDWVRTNWPQISQTITNVMNTVKAVIMGAITFAQAFWARFGDTIIAVTKNTFNTIKTVIENVLTIIRGIVNVIGGLLHGDWSRVWEGLKQIVSGTLGAVIAIVRGALRNLVLEVGAIVGAIGAAALKLGSALKDGIVNGVTGLAKLLTGIVRAALDTVISAWNSFHIPSVHIGFDTHIPGVGTIGFDTPEINFPDVPLLDTGGRVLETGLAVVHKGEEWSGVPMRAGWRGGGETHYHLHVDTVIGSDLRRAGEQLMDPVRRALLREQKRIGQPLFG